MVSEGVQLKELDKSTTWAHMEQELWTARQMGREAFGLPLRDARRVSDRPDGRSCRRPVRQTGTPNTSLKKRAVAACDSLLARSSAGFLGVEKPCSVPL